MSTLLMRLVAPMQSWGYASRYEYRDAGREPSKSGVLGLLAAAMDIERERWDESDLPAMSRLRMGVRCDREGVVRVDFQTAAGADGDAIMRASGKLEKGEAVMMYKSYIADGAFLVGLQGEDDALLRRMDAALRQPRWPIYLGRKSHVPSEHVWVDEGLRVGESIEEAFAAHPWLGRLKGYEKAEDLRETTLRWVLESDEREGDMRMDALVSSFAERRFEARYVVTRMQSFPPILED